MYKIQLTPLFAVTHNYFTNVPSKVLVYPTWKEIAKFKNWCKSNVGANEWNYYGEHKKIPFEFRFKQPEALLAFKLTFGL